MATQTAQFQPVKGAVFTETLRRDLRQAIIWGLGFAAMGFMAMTFVPLFDAFNLVELLEGMPPIVIGMMGIGDDLSVLNTPEGVVAMAYFAKFTIIFAVYPVVLGLRVITADENSGALDMVLSLPVPRSQVIIEKSLAYILLMTLTMALSFVGMLAGIPLISDPISIMVLANLLISLMPLLIFIFMFTVMVGAFFNDRNIVIGLAVALVAGGFVIQTITGMASGALFDAVAQLSVFTYYDVGGILKNGLLWGNNLGLLSVGLVMLGVALMAFSRRDVAV